MTYVQALLNHRMIHPTKPLREAVKDKPTQMHPSIAVAIKPLPANRTSKEGR